VGPGRLYLQYEFPPIRAGLNGESAIFITIFTPKWSKRRQAAIYRGKRNSFELHVQFLVRLKTPRKFFRIFERGYLLKMAKVADKRWPPKKTARAFSFQLVLGVETT